MGVTAHGCVPRVSSRVAGLRGGASLENLVVAAPGLIEWMNVQFAESTSEGLVRLCVELMARNARGIQSATPVRFPGTGDPILRSDRRRRPRRSMCGVSGRRERVENFRWRRAYGRRRVGAPRSPA